MTTWPNSTLPRGIYFKPTADELVEYFLYRKIHGLHIQEGLIPEVDIYGNHPRNITARFHVANRFGEWFFFTRSTRMGKGKKAARSAGPGHWKANQGIKDVKSGGCGVVVGTRQTFRYHSNDLEKDRWLMEEFGMKNTKQGDWVICKIYQKGKVGQELLAFSASSDPNTIIPEPIADGESRPLVHARFPPSAPCIVRKGSEDDGAQFHGSGNISMFPRPPASSCCHQDEQLSFKSRLDMVQRFLPPSEDNPAQTSLDNAASSLDQLAARNELVYCLVPSIVTVSSAGPAPLVLAELVVDDESAAMFNGQQVKSSISGDHSQGNVGRLSAAAAAAAVAAPQFTAADGHAVHGTISNESTQNDEQLLYSAVAISGAGGGDEDEEENWRSALDGLDLYFETSDPLPFLAGMETTSWYDDGLDALGDGDCEGKTTSAVAHIY